MRFITWAVVVAGSAAVWGLALPAGAADKKADKPTADPVGTPLELGVTGKTTSYTLKTGGLTPGAFKKKVEDAVKGGGSLPATPTVDLVVEIKNTADKPVRVWTKGDPVVLELVLKGDGALNADPQLAFTQEFRIPEAVEIPAGKSVAIPVKTLASGFRGVSKMAYWTAPGEYSLVATLKTGVSPSPKGAKEGMDGFGLVTLTSAPLKLTVEAAK